MTRFAIGVLTLALLVACGGSSTSTPAASVSAVSDVHVFSASVIPDGEQASIAVALHNAAAQPDALIGVTCPCAGEVSITGGEIELRPNKVVIVSATGGGPQIVLTRLTTSLQPGDTVTLTLSFTHAAPTSAVAKVEQAR